jgi:iron complex transport system ATP-binding protein
MIIIKDLSYEIRGHKLINSINLDLSLGKIHAIIGPNGAGKSTLLRLISGEIKPTQGSIAIANTRLVDWKLNSIARSRAILPQHTSLSFDYSVEEVVALGRAPYLGLHEETVNGAHAIESVMEQLELTDLRHRNYTTLSGGEQRRVQLARVLAQINRPVNAKPLSPKYLLLDEPVSGLDLSHQHSFLNTVREIADENTAVIISMHDPNHAAIYSDELILLQNGQLMANGSTKDTLTSELLEKHFSICAESIRTNSHRTHFVFKAKNKAN